MMKLFVSNKAYSPWPLRVWLLMRELGLEFEEHVVDLGAPGKAERLKAVSPSGRLPVLVDGEAVVWDSMSIIEYLQERFPEAGIWPRERPARAYARSVAAEMHSGFQALRSRLVMNTRRQPKPVEMSPQVLADIDRLTSIWTGARERFGAGGPFLFGRFSAADAVYAPVVDRFRGYGISVPEECRRYMDAVQMLPGYRAWVEDSFRDPWHNPATDGL